MNNKKILFLLAIMLVFTFCFSSSKQLPEEVSIFLSNHFKIDSVKPDRISWISKKEYYNRLLESHNSRTAKELLQRLWKEDKDTLFVDSVCCFSQREPLNGYFVSFRGDTSWYTIGYYKDGKKDSTWISKGLVTTDIKSYKNGKRNGLWQTFFPDGTKAYECRWEMNTPVDTVFTWHPNGKVAEFEVYEKGKSVTHKCFNKEGLPIECEGEL